ISVLVDFYLFLSTIMEKLNPMKEVIISALNNLYEAIGNRDGQDDLNPYIRTPCTSPVHTKTCQ
ncbi:hypothetical protein INT48_004579, partial [Thamnidium elegans]